MHYCEPVYTLHPRRWGSRVCPACGYCDACGRGGPVAIPRPICPPVVIPHVIVVDHGYAGAVRSLAGVAA